MHCSDEEGRSCSRFNRPATGGRATFVTCRSVGCKGRLFRSAVLLLLCLAGVIAGPAAAFPDTKEATPITIQADRLKTVSAENFAEFSGNVEAIQGTTVIRADILRIYYQTAAIEPARASDNPPLGDAVERITASGNVTITLDNRRAEADQAEYLTQTGVITLTGARARISSGPNVITGRKITLHADTQEITVERGADQRVEALFFTKDTLPDAR